MRRALVVTSIAACLAVGACGSDSDSGGAPGEGPGGTTTSTAGLLPDTVPDVGEPVQEEQAVGVVEDWIAALADGDTDAAWDLVHPSSQEAFGGRAAFDESASAFAEGYGAWDAVGDRTTTWIALDEDSPSGIVVLQGTLRQEGSTDPVAAEAIPVRADDGAVLVDPFQQVVDPTAITVDPASGSTVAPDGSVSVSAPGGQRLEVYVGSTGAESFRPVGGAVAELEASFEGLESGPVPVTVVVLQEDGRLQAEAFGYSVAA